MNQFFMQFINGLNIGSIYALIALGYTMVYGIAKLINFAHGDVIMVGAYISFISMKFGLPWWLAVIISIVACAVLGVVMEKVAYKPLRNASRISLLITAIGISYLLQNLFQLIFGANPQPYHAFITLPALNLGGISIQANYYITFSVSVLLMILLTLFVNKTTMGKAMRAVSEDEGAAKLMGINVDTTISLTFAIGCALAAIAGILYANCYPMINPTLGSLPGIKAFIAAVLGGIGSIPGAVIGAFILGMVEAMTKAYISSQLTDTIVFAILILMLVFKPAGILGKNVKEKV
ncbi:MAG: branched-chain amino acid ABC transporter permease [Solobacterium sp.]|jgi:branched-chain amino acid ABC superfamily ATP binding cassette transporter, membrane protein|uniref:Branched-chain amino acid ABC transporter permease n=2 Tax=Bacteria TaxID=2 RepID=A0A412PIB0_9FIRM|nr:branched-chain amino acid ABC transporter permease [Solobacterium moorei]MBF1107467.1 branched-chain amino acid ABC transporter permease [Solobacterium sp.]MBF1112519.1 branched-chain amino acid ABC transporter permease [Solobacterium sp.]MBF1114063.1 branched-chain amino acid ABC transporter permease [Solobacterium sp.]RGT57890.1 branched-chain amino acid ABC transporter permease [Solobacterium moorei]